MTSPSTPASTDIPEERFQTGEVFTVAAGHFVHDTFSAFVAPLLPLIIEKLALSFTLAGSLQTFLQIPSLLTPFIGYMADRISLRYFVILAPAITATLMSFLGLAPSYTMLVILLLATGVSIACFHAPAPAMIGRISGKQIGRGMSIFMASGELGRTVGPLLIYWAVSSFTLEGYYRIMILGWLASFILFWRLRRVPARTSMPHDIRSLLPTLGRLFIPILAIILFRAFLLVPPSIFLPTLMTGQGNSWLVGTGALAAWELAGVGGALAGGTLSDWLGRKIILLIGIVSGIIFTIIFLNVSGWLVAPVLLAMGFTSLSSTPVMLSIVQEHLPNNRAVGSGLFIAVNFLARPLAILGIGLIGDNFSLETAYFWGAIIALGAIPGIFFLPELKGTET